MRNIGPDYRGVERETHPFGQKDVPDETANTWTMFRNLEIDGTARVNSIADEARAQVEVSDDKQCLQEGNEEPFRQAAGSPVFPVDSQNGCLRRIETTGCCLQLRSSQHRYAAMGDPRFGRCGQFGKFRNLGH